MAIDPNQMAAFAGPKPGEDELDEVDDDIETADDHADDEEVARLDVILPFLEDNAEALEEVCDELSDALLNTAEDLPEEDIAILGEDLAELPEDFLRAMHSALGEIEAEEVDGMVEALAATDLFPEPERIAALFYHVGRLVDEGLFVVEEEEEEDLEEEEEEPEEELEEDLETDEG